MGEAPDLILHMLIHREIQGKEFVLPQKDPTLYNRMLESFNIPELVTGRVKMNPRDFAEGG